MKVGDMIMVYEASEKADCKIIRFYANHGTVLVERPNGTLAYYSYDKLEKHESR